jgi:hypothetical protein
VERPRHGGALVEEDARRGLRGGGAALVVGRDEGEQGRDLVEVQGVREEVDLGGLVFWWRRREEVSQRLEEREREGEREKEKEREQEKKKNNPNLPAARPRRRA